MNCFELNSSKVLVSIGVRNKVFIERTVDEELARTNNGEVNLRKVLDSLKGLVNVGVQDKVSIGRIADELQREEIVVRTIDGDVNVRKVRNEIKCFELESPKVPVNIGVRNKVSIERTAVEFQRKEVVVRTIDGEANVCKVLDSSKGLVNVGVQDEVCIGRIADEVQREKVVVSTIEGEANVRKVLNEINCSVTNLLKVLVNGVSV